MGDHSSFMPTHRPPSTGLYFLPSGNETSSAGARGHSRGRRLQLSGEGGRLEGWEGLGDQLCFAQATPLPSNPETLCRS